MRLGWVPDLPDRRDLGYEVERLEPLPLAVDLRSGCPPVYDQGALGSCTAQAGAALFEYDQKRDQAAEWTPSRLFVYYNERHAMGTTDYDSGATIRGCIKALAKYGACDEVAPPCWPYDVAEFATAPPPECYAEARRYRIKSYRRVKADLDHLRHCLASGFPFAFGFALYESFMRAESWDANTMPAPAAGERMIGGHAVVAVGYDYPRGLFLVRNSWSLGWRDGGHFRMPFSYALGEGRDFWMIEKVPS